MRLPHRLPFLIHVLPLGAASCPECRRSVEKEPTPFCDTCDSRLIAATIADDEEPAPEPWHGCAACGCNTRARLCRACDADYAAYLDENHAAEALCDALALDSFERRGSW